MAVDYDLVVIGSSREGIYAAATAARLQARTALVTQNIEENSYSSEILFCHSLAQIARFVRISQENVFGIYSQPSISAIAELTEARNWSKAVNCTLTEENSLTSLATLGVDVVYGKGEFCRLPQQALIVGNRKLRSRSYLIATGTYSIIEFQEVIQDCGYLTLRDIYRQQDLSSLPHCLNIVGDSPHTLMLAQSLARLGKQIVLILAEKRLLPYEDAEASMLIQAQLEAEGVKILTSSPILQSKNLEEKKWLQVGDIAIETDEIILTGTKKPNVEGLNLAGVGVNCKPDRILVNKKLQTSNPHIYACGDVLGGYFSPSIAQYEANIALKNALFLPWFKTNYSYLPWAILTQPNLARVGMTENQARQRYGDDICIIRQYWKNSTQAQITGNTTGLCKFIVLPQGEIIGAHLVGENAAELISAIALMMKSKLKLSKNTLGGLLTIDFPSTYPSFAETIQQTAAAYYQQKLAERKNLRNWLEIWFDLLKK
ncbi:MAG: NAD(P)/FAD-dependent oxidoreductase [Xenococcaceae cyanobacterium MO_188.B32]|nr:NAD(P)/FAD-dependent oxidoreductase [Xenococcaceae cyanobacterium MO_188.B32]